MKITGIITTFNEERNIVDCIKSLEWCDEVLVVDSFSTDKTVELSTGFDNVRLIQRTYFGSASQKNWAMDHAKHNWLLILDADERCSTQMKEEILDILKKPDYMAYSMIRKTYFLGKVIKFSGWQHDIVTRLVRKNGGRCPNIRSHGGVLAYGEAPLLLNPLIHFMVDDLNHYFERLKIQGYWGAGQFYIDKRKINAFTIVTHTFWRFFRTYIFQLGFLDGGKGLVFCLAQSYGTFVKYSLCWYWRMNKLRGIEPVLPEFDKEITNWYKN